MAGQESVLERNARVHRFRGIGRWRQLCLAFIQRLAPAAVLELGSGDPSFLEALPASATRRLALDGNPDLAPLYEARQIEFHAFDFDAEAPPVDIAGFDVAVCSDVFEHLLYPAKALALLRRSLSESGVLFSHVPNEFRLSKTLGILSGRRVGVYHHSSEEWNDPHLRRFTDLGYRRFLEVEFRHNLKITDLAYTAFPRAISQLGLRVPFCLEGGPTYASTNDDAVLEQLAEAKRAVRRGEV